MASRTPANVETPVTFNVVDVTPLPTTVNPAPIVPKLVVSNVPKVAIPIILTLVSKVRSCVTSKLPVI